jgi:signal peptidase I
MSPTFVAGQRIVAIRARRSVRVGAVVAFTPPLRRSQAAGDPVLRLKRVAAVAGDPTPLWLRNQTTPNRVPPGHLVVTGDAAASQDSRHFGFVPETHVIATVVWPRGVDVV